MSTFWQGRATKAQAPPKPRVGHLYEWLNASFLKECWRDIRKEAASGVDRMSAQDYERHLDEHIHNLVERLKRQQYRAKLVRRQYIPNGDGKLRPLGIPAVEDKLLQLAVTRLLQAIYEQDLLRCSSGDRPPVGALDAVDRLTIKRQFGRYNVVVEADITGFFDHIEHGWWVRMLEERLEDGAFLRLIKQWLKAGGLDTDGQVLHPATGTPQGGSRSPILAKVYLPYALDRWFHQVVKPRGRGEACLIRYADDVVCAVEYQADAERFYRELGQRLGKFGLELAAGKTRVIPFTRQQGPGHTSFDCLGFEVRWGRDRAGKPHLTRRTSRQKLRNALKRVTDWCKERCRYRRKDMFRELNAKLRGYDHYDGVNGNSASLHEFFTDARRILFKWLNRRSQRRSSTWTGFRDLLHHFRVERPHLVGRPPTRLAPGRAEAGLRQRVFLKSPVREHRTPGAVRGRSGHWPSYRDGRNAAKPGSCLEIAGSYNLPRRIKAWTIF
jgi:group II intron reverse transcriptase/maturase